MDDIQFKKNYSAFVNTDYASQISPRGKQVSKTDKSGGTFSEILQTSLQSGKLIFSKHAVQRMDSRRIEISPQLMMKMDAAVEKARQKGIKDALLLSGDAAFIVNIPSGTVVTSLNGGEMKENVFTNIDGAVVL
jgi:flagellar operon protein